MYLLRFNWSRDAAKLNVSDNNHLLFTYLTRINYDDDKNYLSALEKNNIP